ncbi:hypothetical protein COOONC_05001 [Cooperia oncophora]
MYIGLNLTTASSFQMLRGAVIVFTGLLSVGLLGARIQGFKWIGMVFVILGLAVVGVTDILYDDDPLDDKNAIITGTSVELFLNLVLSSISQIYC